MLVSSPNAFKAVVRKLGGNGVAKSDKKLFSALKQLKEIFQQLIKKDPAVFLDYDGTLTPIVSRPEDAILDHNMRQTLKELAANCFVAVISGRDLKDVQNLVGLNDIFYAGSHGFDIAGPEGQRLAHQSGQEFLPALDQAEATVRARLENNLPGVQIERKKFSLAVHYRRVDAGRVGEVEQVVDQVQADSGRLRKSTGKKLFELQPDLDWHKGKALLWLLHRLGLDRPEVVPFYLGDDVTDEDAFKVLQEVGIGIAVQETPAPTAARYRLRDPEEVEKFLKALITFVKESRSE
jgi:trehalose 6-phosphate phosphatase